MPSVRPDSDYIVDLQISGMTRPGIEPLDPQCPVDVLTTGPSEWYRSRSYDNTSITADKNTAATGIQPVKVL